MKTEGITIITSHKGTLTDNASNKRFNLSQSLTTLLWKVKYFLATNVEKLSKTIYKSKQHNQ